MKFKFHFFINNFLLKLNYSLKSDSEILDSTSISIFFKPLFRPKSIQELATQSKESIQTIITSITPEPILPSPIFIPRYESTSSRKRKSLEEENEDGESSNLEVRGISDSDEIHFLRVVLDSAKSSGGKEWFRFPHNLFWRALVLRRPDLVPGMTLDMVDAWGKLENAKILKPISISEDTKVSFPDITKRLMARAKAMVNMFPRPRRANSTPEDLVEYFENLHDLDKRKELQKHERSMRKRTLQILNKRFLLQNTIRRGSELCFVVRKPNPEEDPILLEDALRM